MRMDSAISNKPDLLVVDDDPLITDALDFVLARDFNVFVAESRKIGRASCRDRV